MATVQTQFIFQNCIEPEGTFSQTGSQFIIQFIWYIILTLISPHRPGIRIVCVMNNLVRGQKVVLGPFFVAKNSPRTKLALQNLVMLQIQSAYHFMD